MTTQASEQQIREAIEDAKVNEKQRKPALDAFLDMFLDPDIFLDEMTSDEPWMSKNEREET